MDEFDSQLKKTLTQVARTHSYFKQLERDLESLNRDISKYTKQLETAKPGQTRSILNDIKRSLRDIKYIDSARKRLRSCDTHIEEVVAHVGDRVNFSGPISQAQVKISKMSASVHDLLKKLLSHEIEIQKLLLHLRDEIRAHQFREAKVILIQIQQQIEGAKETLAGITGKVEEEKRVAPADGPQAQDNWIAEGNAEFVRKDYNLAIRSWGRAGLDEKEALQLLIQKYLHLITRSRGIRERRLEVLLRAYQRLGFRKKEALIAIGDHCASKNNAAARKAYQWAGIKEPVLGWEAIRARGKEWKRAVGDLWQTGNWHGLIKLAEEKGDLMLAATFCERIRDYNNAIRLYQLAGSNDHADRLLEKLGSSLKGVKSGVRRKKKDFAA